MSAGDIHVPRRRYRRESPNRWSTQPRIGAHRTLLWLAFVAAVPGALEPSAALISVAAACIGFAVVVHDLARLRRGSLTPVTLFALAFAITGVANALAVQSLAARGRQSPFDLYIAMDYVYLACAVMTAGGTAIIAGFYTARHWRPWRLIGSALPRIRSHTSDRNLTYGGGSIALMSLLASSVPGVSDLGTVTALIDLMPVLAIFTLSRLGAARESRRLTIVALFLSLIVAAHAALFAYLRAEILLPIFALLIGLIVGSRSLGILRRRVLIPVYLIVALFAVNFATLGRIRSKSSEGESRVAAFRASSKNSADSINDAGALVVRLSTVNQLSQVGLLVDEGGFLHGSTLEYLGFAFVPRFLWPAKPKIAKGAWFAYRIGQAVMRPDGTYGNSINMTVPGELYLNFGWAGAVIGSYFFGALLALLWSTAAFWTENNNPLGTAFGFYLIWIGVSLVADLQIVVTLVAMYLLFLAGSLVLFGLRRRRRHPARLLASDVPRTVRA